MAEGHRYRSAPGAGKKAGLSTQRVKTVIKPSKVSLIFTISMHRQFSTVRKYTASCLVDCFLQFISSNKIGHLILELLNY